MVITIDQTSKDPIYLQLRAQIIEAIATGELSPGDGLPSVRRLASDLGINLHTVNKAYAVLRDEGYLLMRGRSGAFVADPFAGRNHWVDGEQGERATEELRRLVVAHKARGGTAEEFLATVAKQLAQVYGEEGATEGAGCGRASAGPTSPTSPMDPAGPTGPASLAGPASSSSVAPAPMSPVSHLEGGC